MILTLIDLLLRRMVGSSPTSEASKDVEIAVLRHQLKVHPPPGGTPFVSPG